jgi:hypothetical protein
VVQCIAVQYVIYVVLWVQQDKSFRAYISQEENV